jgi:hypothetical protein
MQDHHLARLVMVVLTLLVHEESPLLLTILADLGHRPYQLVSGHVSPCPCEVVQQRASGLPWHALVFVEVELICQLCVFHAPLVVGVVDPAGPPCKFPHLVPIQVVVAVAVAEAHQNAGQLIAA